MDALCIIISVHCSSDYIVLATEQEFHLRHLRHMEYADIRLKSSITNCLLELPPFDKTCHSSFTDCCSGACPPSLTHPVVLHQSGVAVFAARLLHEQLLTRGLVLVQHALPRIDHPDGERGEEER